MSRRLRTFGGIREQKSTEDDSSAPAWPALLDEKIEEEGVERVGERDEETHTERGDLPMTFAELGLDEALLKAVQDQGYTEPTLIQAATIPALLQGDDLMGQAKTGTGKTCAFTLPAIQKIDTDQDAAQVIILCPTRELCQQVHKEVEKFAAHTRVRTVAIYGGQPMVKQLRILEDSPHFVVGTPGRVIDHLRRGTLDLHQVRYAVLDEADEMLDMGFIDDIRFILGQTPNNRQTALFSATFPPKIRRLARSSMNDPRVIHTSGKRLTVESVTQIFYEVPESQKFQTLCTVLDQEEISQAVVFVRTRWETDILAKKLRAKGYETQPIHGDLPQSSRNRVMEDFRAGRLDLMVATDVAARGLDISAVSHVINYHLPQDPEIYVHRIGRTARMGAEGWAITLVDPQDYHLLVAIQDKADVHIEKRELPDAAELEKRRRIKVAIATAEEVDSFEDEDYLAAARKLLEGTDDPAKAVGYLFRKLYEIRFPPKKELDLEDLGDTGAEAGMVRIYLNIGREHGIGPADMIKAVASMSGMEGGKVGRIQILDHFSFVQVPEEFALAVLDGLEEHVMGDTVLHPAPAKPQQVSSSELGGDRGRDRDRGDRGGRDRDRGGRGGGRDRDRGRGRGGRDRDRDRDRDRPRRPRDGEPRTEGAEGGEASERPAPTEGAARPPRPERGPRPEGAPEGDGEGGEKRRRRRRRRRGPRPEGGGEGGAPGASGRDDASPSGGGGGESPPPPSGGE